jgi:hypothetical protein
MILALRQWLRRNSSSPSNDGPGGGGRGMLIVETVARIRREHFVKGKTIK